MQENSWLLQRLEPPRAGRMADVQDAFAFGGGLRNGGLSAEAMEILRPIFSFSYMGAAEYEYGAVPQAFYRMVNAPAGVAAHTFDLDWADVALTAPGGSSTIYVICPDGWQEEVEKRFRAIAAGGRTKIDARIHQIADDEPATIGWLECNNGWLAFVDRTAWVKTATLFGLDLGDT